MKTRHVVAIGILTAIAVTLLAIGIKITGQKPKVQTDAYYNLTQYNYTNDTYTIIGRPEVYNTDQKNLIPTINYTIRKNQDNSYYIKLMTNGIFYRTEDDYFDLTRINYETSIINETTTQAYQDKLSDIEIQWLDTNISWTSTTTQLNHSYRVVLKLQNENGILHNEYINFTTSTYTLNYKLFTNDPEGNPYTYETLQIYNTIYELEHTYQTGYTTGYQTKGDLADGNFVSIQETMLNVLTMPFTFISQGFNITLWENTPYEINIGNFIKSLIAIATILFIIKMFTSGFSVIGNYTTGTGNNISQWRKNRSERKLNESKTRLNDRTNPNHKSRDSHVTIKKE